MRVMDERDRESKWDLEKKKKKRQVGVWVIGLNNEFNF